MFDLAVFNNKKLMRALREVLFEGERVLAVSERSNGSVLKTFLALSFLWLCFMTLYAAVFCIMVFIFVVAMQDTRRVIVTSERVLCFDSGFKKYLISDTLYSLNPINDSSIFSPKVTLVLPLENETNVEIKKIVNYPILALAKKDMAKVQRNINPLDTPDILRKKNKMRIEKLPFYAFAKDHFTSNMEEYIKAVQSGENSFRGYILYEGKALSEKEFLKSLDFMLLPTECRKERSEIFLEEGFGEVIGKDSSHGEKFYNEDYLEKAAPDYDEDPLLADDDIEDIYEEDFQAGKIKWFPGRGVRFFRD